MRRFAPLVLALLLSPAARSAFAMGIGPALGVEGAFEPRGEGRSLAAGASCSLKFDGFPVYWLVSTNFSRAEPGGKSLFEFALSGDWWIMNPAIKGVWKWYWGAGLSIRAAAGDCLRAAAGLRALAGMNWFLMDGFLEMFVQAAVEPEALFDWDGGERSFSAQIRFPVCAGARFWF